MLSTLLKNSEFRSQFVTRFSDLMNTHFIPERMIEIIRDAQAVIEPEMPRHIHRWSAPRSMNHWRKSIDNMVEFAEKRPAIQRQHLQEFFDLNDLYTLSVDVDGAKRKADNGNDERMGTVRVNTIELGLKDDEVEKPVAASDRAIMMEDVLAMPWSGQYFTGMPLELEAKPAPGYRFSHWSMKGLDATQARNPKLTLTPDEDVKIRAVMAPDH